MDSWPNQEALNKALNIYRTYMRSFIIFHLKKIPGTNVENVIINSVSDWRADEIDRSLSEEGKDIKDIIDIDDFPLLVVGKKGINWKEVFRDQLNDDKEFQNQLWLIKTCRDQSWAHPPEGDAESEGTRAHLFLIADVLGKIKRTDKQHEVEIIRDDLFSDDTAERLAEAEERLKNVEAENAEYKKSLSDTERCLTDAEKKNSKYEKDTAELSKQVDEKENRIKKLLKQQKEAKARNEKSKKDLAGTKQRLKEFEAEQTVYKEHLATQSNKLKDTKDELASVQAEKDASEKYLAATRNLLTTVEIGDQTVFPPLGTDTAVRILDRRNGEKKNYLLNLLERKQPTIIYVQSEEKIDELLTLAGPEKTEVIGRHDERTSEAEETEILEKLEKGELIAVISNTTLSTLALSHCVEHFVFCHLVPGLDTFFKRCQPAFTPEKNNYLHLIYNNEKDIEGLNQWLTQKYPDQEALRESYRELKKLAKANGGYVNLEEVYNALDMVELEIETGLVIFEELGFLERDGKGIITLFLSPIPRELEESDTYRRGEELKKETAEFRAFQLEYSIEQIWGEILERLNIESEQILRENSIHKIPFRISEYVFDTTEADRDEVAVKVVEMRINSSGSKMSWRSIREKLGLKHDQFHKVIRHSAGYRKAVIDRIKSLKAQEGGWEYSGKLEVLTGIEMTEEELS